MSLQEEVAQWTAQARQTLEEAQKISAQAHTSLNSTTDILTTELPAQITAAEKKFDKALKSHALIVLLSKHVQESVDSVINGHEKRVTTILHPALRDLDTVLATLETVDVPLFLVKKSEKSAKLHYCLADFVATEEINNLRENVQIHLKNCAKMSSLLEKKLAQTLLRIPELLVQFSRLSALYETQILALKPILKYVSVEAPLNTNKAPQDLVGTVLKENNALSLELASLLHMLTNHYDQCMLASNLTPETGTDLEVLRADTLELPAVLKEVHAIHDIIMHNGKRASAFATQKLDAVGLVYEKCDLFNNECREFEINDATRLLLLLVQGQAVYKTSSLNEKEAKPGAFPAETYASTLTALADHYRQFCSVYQAQYLSELHYEKFVYPRKFVKVLDESLNRDLLPFEDEEIERRREWLRKYGDFIPADFHLPGESGLPRLVQVISEGLEDLEAESAREDENRLVQLLKNVHVGK